jgi:hypothetical protein
LCATLSVAKVKRPASGMMAIALRANTMFGLMPAKCTAIPTGTKIRSMLTQLWNKTFLPQARKRDATEALTLSFSASPEDALWRVEDGGGAPTAVAVPAVCDQGLYLLS